MRMMHPVQLLAAVSVRSRVKVVALSALLACMGIPVGATVDPPFVPVVGDADILTTIERLPPSVTRSTATLSSYASYRITLKNDDPFESDELLQPVNFVATTTVVDSEGGPVEGQTAVFDFEGFTLPAGCTAVATTLTCSFTTGLYPRGAFMTFTVAIKAPITGAQVKLTSQASWREPSENSGALLEATAPIYTFTDLTAPDPNTFATFLPLATGGTVSTGTTGCTTANGCKATAPEPFITVAKVPIAGLVSIDQIKPLGEEGGRIIGPRDFFTHLDIPLLRYPPDPIVPEMLVTARIHRSQIGSGLGTPLDALKALLTQTFYWGETTDGVLSAAGYARVHLCLITGGPVQATDTQPGRPCISQIKYYTKFNAPLNPELWGTLEKKIRMRSNGRLTLPSQ